MPRIIWMVVCASCNAAGPPPVVTIAAPPPPASVQPVEQAFPEVPRDYVEVKVAGVVRQSDGAAVALADPTQQTVLPIYVGGTEATSIANRFEHTRYARPLTHDLFDAALRDLGAHVVRAQVDRFEHNTYFGTLLLKHQGHYVRLDARPSDAIAMALGAGAPIYCASAILAEEGVARASFEGLNERGSP